MIKKLIGLFLIFLTVQGFAQKNSSSPYSFFGIGDESTQKTVEEMSMGQIGVAFNSTFQFTMSNPASYASLQYTVYTLAGVNRGIRIDNGITKANSSSAGLSYLALGIPIGSRGGISFGIQPNTSVGYSILQSVYDTDDNLTALNTFEGDGGTNKVYFGFGYTVAKNFNIGLQGNYIFGSTENSILNRRDGVQLSTKYETFSKINGLQLKAGVQYNTPLNDKVTLKTGATIDFSKDLRNEGNEYLYSIVNIADAVIPKDTLINSQFNGTFTKPMSTALSVGLGESNKWYLGLEYGFTEALKFSDGFLNQNESISYGKGSRISVGGYYTPKIASITSYWDRVTYRAGLSIKETGLVVDSQNVNDFGISFGVGLPIGQRYPSNINIGFELGQRGKVQNDLIKENYFNFRVSLTLADLWFVKRGLE
ncbi:hypothetical protein MWU59_01650 [Flavobacteriaceae bacterium F08102]|nr:hypothetical protein [Flavobacteriaceae bacterium F08102]